MADLGYSINKIIEATKLLAVGEENVKQRVQRAAEKHLVFVDIETLPDDLKPLFESIWNRLTQKEPTHKGEGQIQAAVSPMHKKTAAKIAEDIWKLNRILQERRLTGDWSQFED
jgi:hypothetical protein